MKDHLTKIEHVYDAQQRGHNPMTVTHEKGFVPPPVVKQSAFQPKPSS